MPTFHSIPLHSTIRQRLAQASVPITTPQALLTRTPEAVAEALYPADVMQVHHLRYQVALAILTQQNEQQRRRKWKRKRPESEEDTNNNNNDFTNEEEAWKAVTVSAWELYQERQEQELLQQDQNHDASGIASSTSVMTLKSGCASLDDYWKAPLQWCSESGIPRGWVVSLVGPAGAGKTQLALQMAVHAATTTTTTTTVATTTNHTNLGVCYLSNGTLQQLALRCQSLLDPESTLVHHGRRHRHLSQSSVSSNLRFQSFATVWDLTMAISAIQDQPCIVSSNSTTVRTDMIVIDALSNTEQLDRLLPTLQYIARQDHLWIVVVGDSRNAETLQQYSDIQLAMEPMPSGRVQARLTKHVGQLQLEPKTAPAIDLCFTPRGIEALVGPTTRAQER